ncbi:23S rRNA (uracil(1939)-C(5))-methyltransferase RlmD [Roseivirga sp. BDSF3-8]|uniref:23S rRNA (uracil(1939)-C(5))-methyltransferase RlmD n=1 Tax=Roseivirga sp. BDSF3-8 TaxID=3241598 RepID=UPI003532351B
MGRGKKFKQETLEKVPIGAMAVEGKCVARVDNRVVFVEGVAPGDVADLRITKKKKNFFEARAERIHEYSDRRTEPFCEHFDYCGGCKWQHITYETQLAYKHQQVIDSLERIAKVPLPEISPILPSAETRFYRNKLEFTFSDSRWLTREEIDSGAEISREALGFHVPARFDRVIDIRKCYLQPDPSNAVRQTIRAYALENDLTYYNLREHTGLLRNLIIRTANTGQTMVIVQFGERQEEAIGGVMAHLKEAFPDLTALMYIVNLKKNETFHDQEVITYAGRDYIEEEMEGLRFRVGPKSFYQTNSGQAYELYKVARDMAALTGSETVYDLYTGTGTIANFVARQAGHVVGVEYVPEAIEDAKVNSRENGIDNTRFFAGDMKDLLTEDFVNEQGRPDVVITDPPRAGMHADVIQTLLNVSPDRIVYVSCNPATQARDLALLGEQYEVTAVQPVDMFPHTHHVENVVRLDKIS